MAMSKQLGSSLRAGRNRLGLTQNDVANKLGVSKAAVGQWERGVTEPSTLNLFRVCELLRLDVTAVSGGLVHIREIPPAAGEADADDSAYQIEDRRPLPGNKTLFDAKALAITEKNGIPILQAAPIPRDINVSDMFGKSIDAGLVIWNEMVDVCPRPNGIDADDDVICIYMPHDRNSPRYKIGELVFLKKQVGRLGDFVMLEMIGGIGPPKSIYAVFGVLKKQTSKSFVVEESNPPREYVVDSEDCYSYYRALLTHELFGK